MKRPALVAAGMIALAAAAAYYNSLPVPLIFDDDAAIAGNPTIRSLRTAFVPPANSVVAGRPILNATFALNYALGGLSPAGYHTLNLLIHIAAGLTLFGIARRRLALPPAAAVAAIWIVHPLHTGAVTYLSQRNESLMGMFYLLTLYCFIRGTESSVPGRWHVLAVIACVLGMGCREVMVTAPVMVLLYDRTFVAGSFRAALRQRRWLYAGLAGTWLVLGVLMMGLAGRRVGFNFGVSAWTYALTECRAIMHYLRLAVWPAPLVFDYGPDVARSFGEVAPQVLMVVLLVAATGVALRFWPALGFVGAWLFVILAPDSSIVPVAGTPMAEHRMYLPLAAVVALPVAGAFALGRRWLSVAVCVALVALLATLTARRNADYVSPLAIWQDTVEKRPGNLRALYNYAVALDAVGRHEEAMRQYERAVQIKPDSADAHYVLANALASAGRNQDAISQYGEAVRLDPGHANAHYNLGVLLAESGQLDDAIRHHERAVQLKPDFAEAQYLLGVALFARGRAADAARHYEDAIRIREDFADACNNLAWILATDPDERLFNPVRAVELAERACRLTQRRDAGHLDTLAAALAAAGRFEDAVRAAQEAIEVADAGLAGEIRGRLALYKAGQPFRRSQRG